MRYRFSPGSGAHRRLAAAIALAVPLAGAALGGASCEEGPLPDYPVPEVSLRLIPERATLSPDGGTDFVLVELRRPASEGGATQAPVIVYLRVKGATGELLPGPDLCPTSDTDGSGGGSGDGGGGGASGGKGGSGGGEGEDAESADLRIPDDGLLADEPYNARTGGVLITAAEGEGAIDIVATAYSHDGSDPCTPGGRKLLAMANVRIERDKPVVDAGADGAGGSGGSGGAGGSGGGTGTTSTTSSTGGGGQGGSGGSGGGAASKDGG